MNRDQDTLIVMEEVMIKSKDIVRARKVMSDAFREDPDFEYGYVANIAMLLCDRYNKANFRNDDKRDKAARDILKLIFDS